MAAMAPKCQSLRCFCLRDYLRLSRWQRDKLLGILLFLFLQVAIDRVQIVIKFSCVAIAHFTRLFNNFVVPHKSVTRQFLRSTNHRRFVSSISTDSIHRRLHFRISDVFTVPSQQIVHIVNSRDRNVQSINGGLLGNWTLLDQRACERNAVYVHLQQRDIREQLQSRLCDCGVDRA